MILALLLAAAHADEGPLGPLPADTVLVRTEQHFEYVRYYLRTDVSFVIELTPHHAQGEPVCSGGGFDLWVRRDVASPQESFEWDVQPAIIAQACARLPDHPPELAPVPPRAALARLQEPGDPEGVPHAGPDGTPLIGWAPRPLHLVVVTFLGLLAWRFPRDRTALGLGLVALLLRLLLSPRWVLLGGDAAYERLGAARGMDGYDARYGDAWAAIAGLPAHLLGDPPELVHGLNLIASALTVPLLVGLVRGLGGSRLAATVAGLLLATLPLAVSLAAMEDAFVLVGLLQVAALLGGIARGAAGTWLCAAATVLLANLRPEQAPFCLLPLLLLMRGRAWGPLAVAGLACLWRWAEIAVGMSGHVAETTQVIGYARYVQPEFLRDLLLPRRHATIVAFDPFATPLGITGLALVGLVAGWRARVGGASSGPSRPSLGILVAAIVIPLAVYLPKDKPYADPLRFQLSTVTFWCALAGLGAERVWRRGRVATGLAGVAIGVTVWVARAPLDGGWAWQHEYRFLLGHPVPDDTRVAYRADQDPHQAFDRWLDEVSAGDWRPLDATPPSPGTWLYRGTADRIAGVWPSVPCDLEPVDVVSVPSATDGWVTLGREPVQIGYYRVGVCR